jgi:amino acid adenylation domain-containing protein
MTRDRTQDVADEAGVTDMADAEDFGMAIAVIGMAGRFPGARSLTGFWENLRGGVESITYFDDEELAELGVPAETRNSPEYVRSGFPLEDADLFDAPFFGYGPREAALLDPQQRLFLQTAWHALEDAGHAPGQTDLTTGVYAASNLSTYLIANLLSGRSLPPGGDALELVIANDKDYLASRVSYKLDLGGPAISVQSACSSSLVAVHLAAQALLGDECDLAIAGGSTVRLPQRGGYTFREGMIFSSDGHCRPFDADATGTVAGNGVGAVVLRRLEDALADGDDVLAVIRGTAINNDGADKIGYTAPSPHGQARAIADALGVAGTDPDTITAIEAHGTGTPLGDPIEIRALSEVFRSQTDRTGFCAISSVKGNIGHLDSAAGIAGFIKAVLQIHHGELVPNAGYTAPNPEIDFASTPFYVNTAVQPWKSNGHPRRIGVSSFGMGGTNAHVVLEEPPQPRPRTRSDRDLHLLPLSAHDPAALDALGASLAERLRDSPEDDLPELSDVAFTLQTGRRHLPRRRIVVARDAAEAARVLEEGDPARTGEGVAPQTTDVAFLFTGQGSQYPNMGRGLYETEEVFRDRVDACADLLRGDLGFDLREALYPEHDDERAAERLRATAVAQPALFTVEYALAEQLRAWGVEPSVMAGHSVGELTAACLSGVLGLEDALTVVAARGRLMQEQPPGAMLSVALPEEEVRGLLTPELSLAASNAPDLCVVSGPHEPVAALARDLAGREVACRELHTSHAFHSAMMDPVLPELTAVLGRVRRNAPKIPFVAGRTGDWIGAEEAADPAYWAGQARDAVRFGDAVARLAERDAGVLLEIGPGHTLTTLARQHPAAADLTALSTLPAPGEHGGPDSDERVLLLRAVGRVWAAGGRVDWRRLHGGGCRRVRLPAYPFQGHRYWVSPREDARGPADLDVEAPDDVAAGMDDVARAARPSITARYAAPRDATEQRLAAIWERLLGVEPVGVLDDFIELGGHSLLATRVATAITQEFGVSVPLRRLLERRTVAGLAELVTELGGAADTASPEEALPVATPDPDGAYEPFPLSEMQQAQFIGRLAGMQGGGIGAHVYWEVDLDSGVDLDRLEDAWNRLMDRHTMLRAIVTPDGRQRILPGAGPYRIETLDLREAPDREERLAALRDRLSDETGPPDEWPLFDLRVSLLPDGVRRLHLGFDLLIADIGSIRLLLRDWGRLYAGQELPPLELTFRDYTLAAEAIRGGPAYERSLAYWRERTAELPPPPDLPLARSPEEPGRPTFTARRAILESAVWDRVTERASRRGVTASAVLLAVYANVLGAWCRSGRFTLNVTVTNRFEVHEQVPDLVGEFASFDLLAVDLSARDGVAGLARRLQDQNWQDLEYRYLNGVDVLREMARTRGGGAGAVMPIVFTSTLVQQAEPGSESMFGWLGEMTHEIAQTPQVWMDAGVLEAEDGVQLSWHGIEDLFPGGMFDDMFAVFQRIVRDLAASDEAWDRPLGPLLPDRDRALAEAANDTAGPLPDEMLHAPLERRAREHPERIAVIAGEHELTFGDLYARACGLAHRLRALGVGPGRLVAVAMDKSREQIVATLGVLLAGGAYLPIDPDYPAERQDYLLEHGGARVLLSDRAGEERPGVRTVTVSLDDEPADAPPEPAGTPDDLAYVIYTSGSTGRPKGVALSHRAALNTLLDVNERFSVGPDDRVLGLSALNFDLSVWDVFGVLGAGGALVLPEPDARRDPARWLELVTERNVTLWNTVPALAQMFTDHLAGAGPDAGVPLRLALLSGDWIPVDLPDRMRAAMPDVQVVSLGGATEAAVWSIYYPIGEVDPSWDSIPYGRPLRNQTFHVFNDRLEECPVWVPGELYIGGAGVALGYWNDEERTAASFITHPVTGERLYRTGDLGRRLPDGDLEFLGREDFQVKIGGYRIELGEIEAAMLSCDAVDAAVAAAVGEDRHHRRIAAYLVPAGCEHDDGRDEDALVAEVRALLEQRLPGYMMPAAFVVLDRLPLTGNGKVDRNALPVPGAERDLSGDVGGDVDAALVSRLSAIVAEVIGVERVGPRENFFALGGDSIKGIQIVSRANAEGLELTPADIFAHQSVAELAVLLTERGVGTGPAPGDPLPVTAVQHRILTGTGRRGVYQVTLPVEDAEAAARSVRALAERHAVLRLRYAEAGDGWTQAVAELADDDGYTPEIDLRSLAEGRRDAAMGQMVDELAEEIDPVAGPVLRSAVFRLGEETRRLVLLVHELAVDGGSWPILLEDLAAGGEASGVTPDPAGALLARRMDGPMDGLDEAPAPPDGGGSPMGLDEDYRVGGGLDAGGRDALLGGGREAYRMSPAEVMTAVVATALLSTGAAGPVRIDAEVDRRDGERPAGPYASTASIDLDGIAADAHPELLARVKERYRAGGPAGPPAGVLVRHLGRLPGAAEVVLRHPGDGPLTVVTSYETDEGLRVELVSRAADEEEICGFARALPAAMRALTEHFATPGAGAVSPSDFPLAGLDEDELAAFASLVSAADPDHEEDR